MQGCTNATAAGSAGETCNLPGFSFKKKCKEDYIKINVERYLVSENPQESQLREVLDNIPSDSIAPVSKLFSRLRRNKHLEDYAVLPNILMCSIDGTQYYSSKKILCDYCLHKRVLGYDHIDDSDAEEVESLEIDILSPFCIGSA